MYVLLIGLVGLGKTLMSMLGEVFKFSNARIFKKKVTNFVINSC
jgi:hypothetical protein